MQKAKRANKQTKQATGAPTPKPRRFAKKYEPEDLEEDEEEEEVIDPDEGKYHDEMRMGEPEGRDPLFDDEAIEKKGGTQRFRVDG